MKLKALKTYITILGLCISMVPFNLYAQELDATVTISAEQIEAGFRDRLETMRSDLQEFINGMQWTQTQFSTIEKIKCTFAFTILEMPEDDSFKGTLTVQSRRPVYNSNYSTTTLNWQDNNLTFEYTQGQTFNFNEFSLDNELVATVAYYAYLILGIDFDSFSPMGGEPYLQKASNIVSQMQASENKAWQAFADKSNRHAVITALLDDGQKDYRQLWYHYHRQGLDQMSQSVDKGRAQVTIACKDLSKVRHSSSLTPLLSLFISCKLDELINIYSKAPRNEKDEVYKTLNEDFPTYYDRLREIKEEKK